MRCKRNFAKCDFAVTDFLSIETCTVSPGPTMCVCINRNFVLADFVIMRVDCKQDCRIMLQAAHIPVVDNSTVNAPFLPCDPLA